MTEGFDAIIIGAGQAGPFLGAKLAQGGQRVALVESRHLGGTCINHGCTPTKTLRKSARVAHLARPCITLVEHCVQRANDQAEQQQVLRERTNDPAQPRITLSPLHLQRMNLLRVYLNDMNTEEAMNELLKRMRGTKSNEEFLASMNS